LEIAGPPGIPFDHSFGRLEEPLNVWFGFPAKVRLLTLTVGIVIARLPSALNSAPLSSSQSPFSGLSLLASL
jgi:hypothetical protein